MSRRRTRVARLRAADVKALAGFARGYLHQDFVEEYRDAAGAAEAFSRDASAEERAALAADLDRLIAPSRPWTAPGIRSFFTRDLGAAWVPDSVDDLVRLRAAVNTT